MSSENSMQQEFISIPQGEGTFFKKSAFVLFALLPFHVFVVYIIAAQLGYDINDPRLILIKMWKEGVVVLSLLVYFGLQLFGKIHPKNNTIIDYSLILFLVIGLFYTVISDRILLAVWSFRSLYAVLLFYLFGRIQNFETNDFIKLAKVMFFLGIVTALFGVYQVEVIGDKFHLIFYGEEAPVALKQYEYERLRATSTFISVHEFGLFLTLQIFSLPLLLSSAKNTISRLYYFVGVGIIFIGLFYSYSRSSILILTLGLFFFGFRRAKYFLYSILILALIYAALSYFGALTNLETVISGRDPSASGHEMLLRDAINQAIENPFGIGLGKVGVIARRFNPSAPQYEGEWFNILVQMGFIPGLLILWIYYLFFNTVNQFISSTKSDIQIKNLSILIILILFGLVFRDFVLPRDQMNYFFGWFLLGSYVSYIQNKKLSL